MRMLGRSRIYERMDKPMKKEDMIKEKMIREYPKTPSSFQDMIKTRISEQVGEDKAEGICVEQQSRNRAKHTLLRPVKWVAAAAVLLVCGTTAVAAVNPELRNYLLERLNPEDVDTYMQDVEPEVKGKEGSLKDGTIPEELVLSLENPLWEVSDAWYDGATLYFVATPSEEARLLWGKYEIYPSDHSMVNGQDTLFECPDSEHGEGDLPEGEKTGQYHCKIDLAERDISGDMDVTFKLYILDRNSEDYTERKAQEIQFHVDGTASVSKVIENGYEEQEFSYGKVQISQFRLTPSVLYMEVKYVFNGADAKEKAEELYGISLYYLDDSFGKRMDGWYRNIGGQRDIVEEADGSYTVTFWCETEGVDADTDSLTFLPYNETWDSDGKAIPGGEKIVDWATFTVPVTGVE